MFTISKEFGFEASHQLYDLPDDHQCMRVHGHSYRVVVEIQHDRLTAENWIMDYADLAPLKDFINRRLDHRHLNQALPNIGNPTAEAVAAHLGAVVADLIPDVVHFYRWGVGVSETAKTWAWWWSTR